MSPDRMTPSGQRGRRADLGHPQTRVAPINPLASIAAMPKMLRPILLALILAAASAGAIGCGGNGGPDPSLSAQEAAVLTSKIDEINANVDVGSCLVAADKTDDLIADINNLPSSVNSDVKQALDNGANNLKLLLTNPDKCQGRATTTTETTTSTPSTTESTTTTRTRPSTTTTTRTQTQPTTTTQTQTTPTTTPGASGGIGPGGL
jgi:methylaspartate ammonia-lyase